MLGKIGHKAGRKRGQARQGEEELVGIPSRRDE